MPRNLKMVRSSRLLAVIVVASLFVSFQAGATTLLKKDLMRWLPRPKPSSSAP